MKIEAKVAQSYLAEEKSVFAYCFQYSKSAFNGWFRVTHLTPYQTSKGYRYFASGVYVSGCFVGQPAHAFVYEFFDDYKTASNSLLKVFATRF